jgi:hypothetical protein
MWNLINVLNKKNENIYLCVFPMIFQSSMGPRNWGVMVPNGTTQRNSYPKSMGYQNKWNSNNSLQHLHWCKVSLSEACKQ